MIQIRPVSDLRNKYPEIEELVLNEDEAVYLTKNGYGSMVVMSLEKYSKLISDNQTQELLNNKFGKVDVDNLLEESEDDIDNINTKYLTHDQVFSKVRRIINDKK